MANYDSNKLLYKYRGFNNIEFALDIFLNERLYAADFRSLNDPMEGRFRYSKSIVDKDRINEMLIEKTELGILSLSEDANNHLLWSYYAEGHSGFAVGVQILPDQDLFLEQINYVDDFRPPDFDAKSVLTMKHNTWQHENEYRVLKPTYTGDHFVKIKIKELIFGKNAANNNQQKMNLLSTLVKRLNLDIEIKTIEATKISEWLRNV